METLVEDTLQWIRENENASLEDYESKKKEVEGQSMPIMQKMYQSAVPPQQTKGGMPHPMKTASSD